MHTRVNKSYALHILNILQE